MLAPLAEIVNSLSAGVLVGAAATVAALLFLMGYLVDRRAVARRSREFFTALNDSAYGVTVASIGPGACGFQAVLQPPPEPFAHFAAIHETGRELNPLAWLFPATVKRREYLSFFANLPDPPTQELAWARHRTPPAPLSTTQDPMLWTLHHLDFADAEYATRGDNPNGVRHAFGEMQTRFGPILAQLTVYRDDVYHVRGMVRSSSLAGSDVVKFVGMMRALGRAASL